MPQVERASLSFWLELISCDKNWFLVTRIDLLWQELIYCDIKGFLVTRITLLYKNIFILTNFIWCEQRLFIFKIFTYPKKNTFCLVCNFSKSANIKNIGNLLQFSAQHILSLHRLTHLCTNFVLVFYMISKYSLILYVVNIDTRGHKKHKKLRYSCESIGPPP